MSDNNNIIENKQNIDDYTYTSKICSIFDKLVKINENNKIDETNIVDNDTVKMLINKYEIKIIRKKYKKHNT